MNRALISRRESFGALGAAALVGCVGPSRAAAGQSAGGAPMVGTTTWPWMTFAEREEKDLEQHTDSLLSDIASTGIKGYEPIVEEAGELEALGPRLRRHGLTMASVYTEPDVYEPDRVESGIRQSLAVAKAARGLGAKIIVTNPAPISWDEPGDKTDEQLRTQASALNRLGEEFQRLGLTLAYHNHMVELNHGAREFHHMLTATDPRVVKLCLDAHWIFRGCGESQVAVFDVLTNYGDRIVELHLRQSSNGVWTESFSMEGDIDYVRMFAELKKRSIKPYCVLEQAVEDDTPKTLSAVAAHRRGCESVRRSMA